MSGKMTFSKRLRRWGRKRRKGKFRARRNSRAMLQDLFVIFLNIRSILESKVQKKRTGTTLTNPGIFPIFSHRRGKCGYFTCNSLHVTMLVALPQIHVPNFSSKYLQWKRSTPIVFLTQAQQLESNISITKKSM